MNAFELRVVLFEMLLWYAQIQYITMPEEREYLRKNFDELIISLEKEKDKFAKIAVERNMAADRGAAGSTM